MATKVKLFLFNLLLSRKEKEIMAKVYATLIIKGEMKFSAVAKTQKEKVRKILIELECEELIEE